MSNMSKVIYDPNKMKFIFEVEPDDFNSSEEWETFKDNIKSLPQNCGITFNKDIINLNKTLKQSIDKPIFYASRYGNKYIVPQKLFEEQCEVLNILKKYAKNDDWSDGGWTIEFWNMKSKEIDKVSKWLTKKG